MEDSVLNRQLFEAVISGDIAAICTASQSGAVPTFVFPDEELSTALHAAIFLGNVDAVRLLLQSPLLDINAKDGKGSTIVQHAVRFAGREMLEDVLCVEPCPDLTVKNKDGQGLVQEALLRDNAAELVHPLVTVGAEVDCKDNEGQTPLYWAVKSKNWKAAALLLDHDASPYVLCGDPPTTSPLALATRNSEEEDAILFMSHPNVTKLNVRRLAEMLGRSVSDVDAWVAKLEKKKRQRDEQGPLTTHEVYGKLSKQHVVNVRSEHNFNEFAIATLLEITPEHLIVHYNLTVDTLGFERPWNRVVHEKSLEDHHPGLTIHDHTWDDDDGDDVSSCDSAPSAMVGTLTFQLSEIKPNTHYVFQYGPEYFPAPFFSSGENPSQGDITTDGSDANNHPFAPQSDEEEVDNRSSTPPQPEHPHSSDDVQLSVHMQEEPVVEPEPPQPPVQPPQQQPVPEPEIHEQHPEIHDPPQEHPHPNPIVVALADVGKSCADGAGAMAECCMEDVECYWGYAARRRARCCAIFFAFAVLVTSLTLIGLSVKTIHYREVGVDVDHFTGKINLDKIYVGGQYFTGLTHTFVTFPRTRSTIKFMDDGDQFSVRGPLSTRTKEGMPVTMPIAFQYTVDEADIPKIVMLFGAIHREVLVLESQSIILNVIAEYTASQLFYDRVGFTTAVQQALTTGLAPMWAKVTGVQVGFIDLFDAFEEMIGASQIAQQDGEKAWAERSVNQVYAQIEVAAAANAKAVKLIHAHADAQSTNIMAQADALLVAARTATLAEALHTTQHQLGLNQTNVLEFAWLEGVKTMTLSSFYVDMDTDFVDANSTAVF